MSLCRCDDLTTDVRLAVVADVDTLLLVVHECSVWLLVVAATVANAVAAVAAVFAAAATAAAAASACCRSSSCSRCLRMRLRMNEVSSPPPPPPSSSSSPFRWLVVDALNVASSSLSPSRSATSSWSDSELAVWLMVMVVSG